MPRFGWPPETARADSAISRHLATKDSSAYQADLALFSAHMQRREYDKALADVDRLEKKQPNVAFVQNLRGTVYLAKRDLKSARASFEKALELQPDFLPAARNLTIIDLQDGNVAGRAEPVRQDAREESEERPGVVGARGTADGVRRLQR